MTPEGIVLRSVLGYLRVDPRVAWAMRVNTGAVTMGEGKESRFLRFGAPGCSDIIGQLKDGRLLALEVKSPKGRLTQLQESFLEQVIENNGVGGMVRSIDDARMILGIASG